MNLYIISSHCYYNIDCNLLNINDINLVNLIKLINGPTIKTTLCSVMYYLHITLGFIVRNVMCLDFFHVGIQYNILYFFR